MLERRSSAPQAPGAARRGGWAPLGALVALALTSACHTAAAAPVLGSAPAHCPAGTFDYGDGMVACALPEATTQALRHAHAAALEAAGTRRSTFLADQPWRPHVSVIYGVTAERASPAQQALAAFVGRAHNSTACFGGLQYWDDARGDKTTLVVDVHEPAGELTALHDRLAVAAHIGSRFAYHPHVTLAYLERGVRLDAAQEASVLAPLAGVCWQGDAYYLTDRCGQVLWGQPAT